MLISEDRPERFWALRLRKWRGAAPIELTWATLDEFRDSIVVDWVPALDDGGIDGSGGFVEVVEEDDGEAKKTSRAKCRKTKCLAGALLGGALVFWSSFLPAEWTGRRIEPALSQKGVGAAGLARMGQNVL